MNETNKQICAIYLSIINKLIKLNNYKHMFCKRCIEVYFQSFTKCPICKIEYTKLEKLYNSEL